MIEIEKFIFSSIEKFSTFELINYKTRSLINAFWWKLNGSADAIKDHLSASPVLENT